MSDFNDYIEQLKDCRDKLQNRVDTQKQDYGAAVVMGIISQDDINRKIEKDAKLIEALTAAISAMRESAGAAAAAVSNFSEAMKQASYECPHCGMKYPRRPLLICYNGCKRRLGA